MAFKQRKIGNFLGNFGGSAGNSKLGNFLGNYRKLIGLNYLKSLETIGNFLGNF
jgi:hypothetical protein